MSDKKTPKTFTDELLAALKGPLADWVLSGMLALFMAFVIGVFVWEYDGPRMGYRYGPLSFLGVWLLCFWAVALARRLLVTKRQAEGE